MNSCHVSLHKNPQLDLRQAQSQSLTVIHTRQHGLAPLAIVEVPSHGLRQPRFEIIARLPPELRANLRRVDRVAAVVPRAVGHKSLQLEIASLSLTIKNLVIRRRTDIISLCTSPNDYLVVG